MYGVVVLRVQNPRPCALPTGHLRCLCAARSALVIMQTLHSTEFTASRVSHRCISRSAPCHHPVAVHRRYRAAAAGTGAEPQSPEVLQQQSVQLSRRQWLQAAAAAALLVSATPYQAAAEADGVVSATRQLACTLLYQAASHQAHSFTVQLPMYACGQVRGTPVQALCLHQRASQQAPSCIYPPFAAPHIPFTSVCLLIYSAAPCRPRAEVHHHHGGSCCSSTWSNHRHRCRRVSALMCCTAVLCRCLHPHAGQQPPRVLGHGSNSLSISGSSSSSILCGQQQPAQLGVAGKTQLLTLPQGPADNGSIPPACMPYPCGASTADSKL
jgi:hypothetical protein